MPGLYNPRAVSPGTIAAALSLLTRLPVLSAPLLLLAGVAGSGPLWGSLWAVLSVALTGGASTFYLDRLERSGVAGDPQRLARGVELRPLRMVAAFHVAAFGLVSVLGGPPGVRALLLVFALLVVLFAVLYPGMRLSLHAAGSSAAAVYLVHLSGWWGLAAALLVPAVWWSRTHLSRQSPRELLLGTLAGTAGTWASLQLLAG